MCDRSYSYFICHVFSNGNVVVNDAATTEIYTYVHTLSLHDALPICFGRLRRRSGPSLDLPLDLRLGFGLGGLLGGFLGRLLGRQLGGALGGGEGGLQLVQGGIAAGGFLNRPRGGRRGGSAGAVGNDMEAGDEVGVLHLGLRPRPPTAPPQDP